MSSPSRRKYVAIFTSPPVEPSNRMTTGGDDDEMHSLNETTTPQSAVRFFALLTK